MDVPRDRIDMPPLEWKPQQSDGHLNAEEYEALRTLVSRFYERIAKSVRPESPDFSIWFGENRITVSGNLPELDPDTVRVALAGQTLVVRGVFRSLAGSPTPPRTFQKIFMLPFPVDPRTLQVDWMMNFLIIQAQRLQQDRPQAA